MKITYRLLCLNLFTILLVACKNDSKGTDVTNDKDAITTEKNQNDKAPLSEKTINQINSVLTKTMVTKELKTFVSALITAKLTNVLSTQVGPYTVLAPTNDAFNSITEEQKKSLFDYNNKEFLKTILNTHIVEGNFDTASIVQSITKNKGNYSLNTLSGTTLKASMDGSNIVITDEKGNKAVIGKSDIIGSNGIVHTLDAVLGLD